jgi:hypothetical protein
VVESKRLNILKALTDHLKSITTANGYDSDLSEAVFRGRALFDDSDPIPMLSILESPKSEASFATNGYEARKDDFSLFLQGWVKDDPANPTDPAYLLAAEVEKCLTQLIATKNDNSGRPEYPNAYLLGGSIVDIKFGPPIVRPPTEQISSKAFFYLPVVLTLAT